MLLDFRMGCGTLNSNRYEEPECVMDFSLFQSNVSMKDLSEHDIINIPSRNIIDCIQIELILDPMKILSLIASEKF